MERSSKKSSSQKAHQKVITEALADTSVPPSPSGMCTRIAKTDAAGDRYLS